MDKNRSQIREVINRNIVVSLALGQGYNAYLPVFDGGVDFVLLRERDGVLLKVQLKGRWSIDKKYLGRNIWVAFPIDGDWHLMEHDRMVEFAEQQGYTRTASWLEKGIYNIPTASKAIRESCAPYRFAPIGEHEESCGNA